MLQKLMQFGFTKSRIAAFIVISLVTTFFEGFGMAMFLPVLEFVEKGGDIAGNLAAGEGVWHYLASGFSLLNLEVSLPALVAVAVLLMVLRVVFIYVRTVYTAWLMQDVLHVTRTRIFNAYLDMDYGAYSSCSSGTVVNVLATESVRMNSGLSALLNFVSTSTVMGGFVCVLLWLSVPMTGLAFLFLALAGGVVSIVVRSMRRVSYASTDANKRLSNMLLERLGAFRLIKLTATARREEENVFRASEQVRNFYFRIARLLASVDLVVEPVVLMAGGGILCFAVLAFDMSLAKIGLFMLILLRMMPLAKELLKLYQGWRSCAGSVSAVVDGLEQAVQQAEDGGGLREFKHLAHGISMQGVGFTYPSGDGNALSDVDLEISAGKVTALVGPSGAGKTTLADLVPRLRVPTDGQVLYDGVDGAEFDTGSLRRSMAFVSQDATILNDTVAANLRFAVPDATQKQLLDALDRAQARTFVESMPQGLDTVLGERGTRLSGGQKQRLSLARALLQQTSVLILDEPTSALDSETERDIQQAITALRRDGETTIIIIAHRLSTIRNADSIVVLENGFVREQGTHEELMRPGTWYREMFAMQGGTLEGM